MECKHLEGSFGKDHWKCHFCHAHFDKSPHDTSKKNWDGFPFENGDLERYVEEAKKTGKSIVMFHDRSVFRRVHENAMDFSTRCDWRPGGVEGFVIYSPDSDCYTYGASG